MLAGMCYVPYLKQETIFGSILGRSVSSGRDMNTAVYILTISQKLRMTFLKQIEGEGKIVPKTNMTLYIL